MSRTRWPTLPTTETWKAQLAAALLLRGRGAKKALAEHLQVNQSTVSHLMSTHQRSSQYVEPASKWAGIALPVIGDQEWVNLGLELAALAPEKYAELLQKGKAIAAARKKKRRRIKGLD